MNAVNPSDGADDPEAPRPPSARDGFAGEPRPEDGRPPDADEVREAFDSLRRSVAADADAATGGRAPRGV
jgi:hypothetical protein